MTKLSQEIFEKHKIRKTVKQKDEFIKLVQDHYPQMQIQEFGMLTNRNLIIGNLTKSKTVVCAHYDTGTNLFISNMWFPRNLFLYILYQFVVATPLVYAVAIAAFWLWSLTPISSVAFVYACAMLHILSTAFGTANKNNVNCNTSGVVTLFEVLENMSEEERKNTTFVLFDNKEKGLLGSAYFRKRYRELLKNRVIINLECVGDGDHIMVAQNKEVIEKYTEEVMSSFKKIPTKNIILESANKVIIPSDQVGFPSYITITAFKKSERLGLYLNNIRTKKDTHCDLANIDYIKTSILEFIRAVK